MSSYDPIPALLKLGYTPREAAFLRFAGIHSGYFLRRQFNQFIRRDDGAMSQRFLAKLLERDHAQMMDFGFRRYVLHLSSKTIYRLLDIEDSQNRRVKGDREIKSRLMELDYMLDHADQQFLGTEPERAQYFHEHFGIDGRNSQAQILPDSSWLQCSTHFVTHFPIAVHPQLSFVFIDDGLRTVRAFDRFLSEYEPVFLRLNAFEVVYAAENQRNFERAESEFLRHFPKQLALLRAGHDATNPDVLNRQPKASLRGHELMYVYPVLSPRYRKVAI